MMQRREHPYIWTTWLPAFHYRRTPAERSTHARERKETRKSRSNKSNYATKPSSAQPSATDPDTRQKAANLSSPRRNQRKTP